MFTTQDLPTNYYTTLHLPNTATEEDIRKSYRELARTLHPDKNPNDPKATSKFQLLHEAYSTLSDPLKRSQYDAYLQSSYNHHQSRHAAQQTRRSSTDFDPEYQYARFQDPRRFRSQPPKKPTPSPAEIARRERREKEHLRNFRKEAKSWEKFAEEFAKKEEEKEKQRVAREGPIPGWLDNVVAAERETLIDFGEDLTNIGDKNEAKEVPRPVFPKEMRSSRSSESATAGSFVYEAIKPVLSGTVDKENSNDHLGGLDPKASTFNPEEWTEAEIGRLGERLKRRGSLGSRGRRACDEARRVNNLSPKNEAPADEKNEVQASDWNKGENEWDVFFDRFETGLKV